MRTPKLILQLRSVSPKAFRRFTAFVHSPYHSRHAETIALFDALQEHYPNFDIGDEALFDAAFPGKPYDNARLRILRSYLLDLLEKFHVVEQLESEAELREELYLQHLSGSRDYKARAQHIQRALDILRRKDVTGISGLHYRFRIEEARMDTQIQLHNRSAEPGVQDVLHPLDCYAMATRLKLLCSLWNAGQSLDISEGTQGIPETLHYCQALNLQIEPIVGIYYNLLQLFITGDHAAFYPEVRWNLDRYRHQYETIEQVNIYGFLINYFNFRYQAGQPDALEQMFATYKQMLELDLLFDHGSFSVNHLKNLITLGARLGEVDWTADLLKAHQDRIPAPWRDGVFHYGMAYLDFTRGAYGTAKKHLLSVEFFDPLYKVSHQVLLLRIYYEMNDVDALEALSASFERYLQRNKAIAAPKKKSLRSLLRFVHRLMRLRSRTGRQKAAAKLRQDIAACPLLTDRTWVAAKAAELH